MRNSSRDKNTKKKKTEKSTKNRGLCVCVRVRLPLFVSVLESIGAGTTIKKLTGRRVSIAIQLTSGALIVRLYLAIETVSKRY